MREKKTDILRNTLSILVRTFQYAERECRCPRGIEGSASADWPARFARSPQRYLLFVFITEKIIMRAFDAPQTESAKRKWYQVAIARGRDLFRSFTFFFDFSFLFRLFAILETLLQHVLLSI